MSSQSSQPLPSLDVLRALAAAQGVHPTDVDLETARTFLEGILPALGEIERSLARELPPVDPFASTEDG